MPSDESVDPRLNDYADRYRNHFALTRTGGVLEIRMHTDGGPARFSLSLKHALGRLWREVSADTDNEVIIFTGTGESWMAGVDPESLAAMNSVQQLPSEQAYQLLYADGLAMIQDLVLSVEVPTIGVINGPGPRKETALMCDITLCAEHATFSDGNFAVGHAPPGDGMHLVLQEALVLQQHRETLRSSAPLTGEQRSIFIQLGPELDQPSTSNAVGSMHRNHSRALGR